jgi:hypothetical protein
MSFYSSVAKPALSMLAPSVGNTVGSYVGNRIGGNSGAAIGQQIGRNLGFGASSMLNGASFGQAAPEFAVNTLFSPPVAGALYSRFGGPNHPQQSMPQMPYGSGVGEMPSMPQASYAHGGYAHESDPTYAHGGYVNPMDTYHDMVAARRARMGMPYAHGGYAHRPSFADVMELMG